jgi:redox-sensitive bicupin YhaK (pirin superfamily)
MDKGRDLVQVVGGVAASDGAGVQLQRIIGSPELDMLDPFLMLDAFGSDKPNDYIAGFPSHPHRGFETVTYIIAGRMRHKDSTGREGVIGPGDVQWMTAGKGIIHSEMPEQEEGLLMGFQLWVNLPASAKMTEPVYQEFLAEEIPLSTLEDGSKIRVICGQTNSGVAGIVSNDYVTPTFMDITLPNGNTLQQDLPENDNAFIYVLEGSLNINEDTLENKKLGVLGKGKTVVVSAVGADARFILVAGQPINEPVARAGPFVMNTKEEVVQAFQDYQQNRFQE